MRILFIVDPWIYRNQAGLGQYTFQAAFEPAMKSLQGSGHSVRLILGHDLFTKLTCDKNEIDRWNPVVIYQDELYRIYPDFYEAHISQFKNTCTQKQIDSMSSLMTERLLPWVPDAVIMFLTPMGICRYCFPNSVLCELEYGMLSRTPYPRLYSLDPHGSLMHSYLRTYPESHGLQSLTPIEHNRLEHFRDIFRKRVFAKHNPFRRDNYDYQYVVLLPLSYSGVVISDGASPFRSQFDMLFHVLSNISSDIGVVVTRHGSQVDETVYPDTAEYLKQRFPNLIFDERTSTYAFASQWLVPILDGVISTNSSLLAQAALWRKPAYVLGDGAFVSLSAARQVTEIAEDLCSQPYVNHDSWIYHMLTRYYVPERLLHDSGWLTDRLSRYAEGNNSVQALPRVLQDEDALFRLLEEDSPGLQTDYSPKTWNRFS